MKKFILIAGLGLSLAGCGAASDIAASGFASDQIEVYELAKRNNDSSQTCIQSQVITQMYLQGKDEPNYQKWKSISKQDCDKAQADGVKELMTKLSKQ